VPFAKGTPFFKSRGSLVAGSKTTPYFKGQKPAWVTQFSPTYLDPRAHAHRGGGDPVLHALSWFGHESAHVTRGTASILGQTAASVYHHDAHYLTGAGRWAVRHPDTFATVLALAAIGATGPVGIGLELAAAGVSAYSASRAARKGDFVEAALDMAAVEVGAGSISMRLDEMAERRLARIADLSARSTQRAASFETRRRELRRLNYQIGQLRQAERLHLKRRADYALVGQRADAVAATLSALGIDPSAIYTHS